MKFFARFISWLFHPVIFALLLPFIIVYWQTADTFYAFKWMAFSSCFLILTLFIFYLVRPKEFFKDFDIYKREQRVGFYTISCIIALLYFLSAVYFKGIFFPLSALALGIVIGLVFLEIVNFYIKASIHVAVTCAFAILMGVLYGMPAFLFAIWIPMIVAWSRYTLNKHTPSEIFAGALFGSFVTGFTFFIGKLIL